MAVPTGDFGSVDDQKISPMTAMGMPNAMPGGRVPLQERVASTSQMPTQPGRQPSMSHETRQCYEKHDNNIIKSQQGLIDSQRCTGESQRKEMESQRRLFDDEKALWQKREADLVRRIDHLESLLHRLSHSSPTASIPEATAVEQNGGCWTPTTSSDGSKTVSRQSSTSEAPVWNPRPDHQATRVFPETSTKDNPAHTSMSVPSGRSTSGDQMAKNNERKRSGIGNDIKDPLFSQGLRKRPSIPGHLISKDYDGIMFKSARMPSNQGEVVTTLQSSGSGSPSSHSTCSPSQVSPQTRTPVRNLTLSKDIDPTLKDAGHTPMARGSISMFTTIDDGPSGDNSSTPKAELERPPLEPRTTNQERPKQPSERQDSYFGSLVAPADYSTEDSIGPQVETPDQDLSLEGPLGLTNTPDNERNKVFLGELDKKLSNVNLRGSAASHSEASTTLSPTSTAPSAQTNPTDTQQQKELQNIDGSPCEVPEAEPPLRFKKSLNFGSVLGEGCAERGDYGKRGSS